MSAAAPISWADQLRATLPARAWQTEAWRDARVAATPDAMASVRAAVGTDDAYALAPFSPLHDGGKWWIAANAACLADADDDEDGDILLVDGRDGTMTRLGDDAADFYGDAAAHGGVVKVWSNGILFLRAWAALRCQRRASGLALALHGGDAWFPRPHMPGVAMLGAPGAVRGFAAVRHAARLEIDNPRLVRPLADALLRAARLPVVACIPPREAA